MFEFDTIRAAELSAKQIDAWNTIQEQDSRFASPFFRPEFTQALAQVCEDVRVALLLEDGSEAGFLALESSNGVGRPAGYPMSSFHGVVTQASGWSLDGLLPAAGLKTLRFDHWISTQPEMRESISVRSACERIDLSDGFDVYAEQKRRQGSKLLRETCRLKRKLEREVGEVRCVRSHSLAAFEQLCRWKSLQCERTGAADLFSFDWPQKLLRALLVQATNSFGGELWELHSGDNMIAANYVLRSRDVAHGWFMSFDTRFGQYSPGMILIYEILRQSEAAGIARLDLGTGASKFKRRLMTDSVEVGSGVVDPRPVARAVWSQWLKTRDWIKTSRLRNTALRVDRMLTNSRRACGGKC